jgi:hypothetical protein
MLSNKAQTMREVFLILQFILRKHIYKYSAVLKRLDLMPLVTRKVNRLSVFGHYKLTAFFADDAATRMTHGQMRVDMLMARQTLTFVGVVHRKSCTVISDKVFRAYGLNHSV